MHVQQLNHLARAAAGLLDGPKVAFVGMASLLQLLPHPSPRLESTLDRLTCADLVAFDHVAPDEGTALLNEALGEGSAFQRRPGIAARAHRAQDVLMPTDWHRRLRQVGFAFHGNPVLLAASPADYVLANMAQTSEPLVNMELVLKQAVDLDQLERLLANWALPSAPGLSNRPEIAMQLRALRATVTRVDAVGAPLALHQADILSIVGRGLADRSGR